MKRSKESRAAAKAGIAALSFCILAGCDEAPPPSRPQAAPPAIAARKPDPPAGSDAYKVMLLRQLLAHFEGDFQDRSGKLEQLMAGAASGDLGTDKEEEFNREFREDYSGAMEDLASANALQVPPLTDPILKRSVTAVVKAHKQWAAAQRSKMRAFFSDHPDLEAAMRYVNKANKYADEEARNLVDAVHQAGLE